MRTTNKLNFKKDPNFCVRIGDSYKNVYKKLEALGFEVTLSMEDYVVFGKAVDSEKIEGLFSFDLNGDVISQIYFFF